MRIGSLFTGIGGIDLGFIRAGYTVDWMSEIAPYQSQVLALRFPGVPNYGDVRGLIDISSVDVLIGGFPCQDISNAGRRRGIDGERSGLWGEFLRVIRLLRPEYVVVENVRATLSPHRREGKPAPLARILGGLSESGYDAEWQTLSAESVGAPHLRERVFIVAYPNSEGLEVGQIFGEDTRQELQAIKRGNSQGAGHWALEPDMGRLADGVPYRMDRLISLGNAVVPQVAELVARQVQRHKERRLWLER